MPKRKCPERGGAQGIFLSKAARFSKHPAFRDGVRYCCASQQPTARALLCCRRGRNIGMSSDSTPAQSARYRDVACSLRRTQGGIPSFAHFRTVGVGGSGCPVVARFGTETDEQQTPPRFQSPGTFFKCMTWRCCFVVPGFNHAGPPKRKLMRTSCSFTSEGDGAVF